MSAEDLSGRNPEIASNAREAQLRLHYAVQDSYDDLPAQQEFFEAAVQAAVDSTYDAEMRQDFKIVGDTLRWQMFGRLASEPVLYPALQAARICIDAQNGSLDIDEVTKQIDFLNNLKNDEDIRRQLGFERYTPQILDLLLTNARELHAMFAWPELEGSM
jgi:hypothetical protein